MVCFLRATGVGGVTLRFNNAVTILSLKVLGRRSCSCPRVCAAEVWHVQSTGQEPCRRDAVSVSPQHRLLHHLHWLFERGQGVRRPALGVRPLRSAGGARCGGRPRGPLPAPGRAAPGLRERPPREHPPLVSSPSPRSSPLVPLVFPAAFFFGETGARSSVDLGCWNRAWCVPCNNCAGLPAKYSLDCLGGGCVNHSRIALVVVA